MCSFSSEKASGLEVHTLSYNIEPSISANELKKRYSTDPFIFPFIEEKEIDGRIVQSETVFDLNVLQDYKYEVRLICNFLLDEKSLVEVQYIFRPLINGRKFLWQPLSYMDFASHENFLSWSEDLSANIQESFKKYLKKRKIITQPSLVEEELIFPSNPSFVNVEDGADNRLLKLLGDHFRKWEDGYYWGIDKMGCIYSFFYKNKKFTGKIGAQIFMDILAYQEALPNFLKEQFEKLIQPQEGKKS